MFSIQMIEDMFGHENIKRRGKMRAEHSYYSLL